ncbi:tape measure protein, partial [Cloacibacillus sp. An23]|uniref:tape measure protein n=1 Tax=Cloacibacillus sp. An23 TaxID=1965591 RepID=UPI00117806B5
MASTTLQYRITANISAAVSGFSQLAQRVEQANKRINKSIDATFGKNAVRMSQSLLSSVKYAAAGLTALGVAAVKMSADFQVAQKSMTVLTGSADAAQKHLRDLERFAATTPFDFAGLVDASKRLQAYGFQAEAVIPILNNVGNAAAALGLGQEGIDRITLALGQMASKGKVSAEEMLQLTETGIAGWQMLADYTGQSVAEVQAQASKGAISAQTALEAIFTGMRDRFDGIMEESADEIPYQLSNMQDSISSIMRSIGDSITEGLDLKTKMSDVSTYLTALSQEIKTSGVREAFKKLVPPEVQGAIAAVATAITVMLIPALAKLGVAMLAAGGPFTLVAGVAAAAAYVIVTKWDELGKFFEDLKDRIAGFFDFLARKGEEASVRVGKVADNVKMDFSGLFSSKGAAVRGGLNLVPENKSGLSIMEQARQIVQKYSAGFQVETDPTKFLAGSVASTGSAVKTSAAEIKAAAREAEKAAKEAIRLDAENADRVLARIEKQKEAAKELAEIYERADREYLSGLGWENSQGLLSNSDYFNILNQRVEELGLKVKGAFNMTDGEKALFSDWQSAGTQQLSDTLDTLKKRYESGAISAGQYKAQIEALKQQFAELPLAVKLAGEQLASVESRYLSAGQQAGAVWEDARESLMNFPTGIGSAFESAIRGTESLSDAMLGLLQDIGAVIVKALIMRAL